MNYRLQVKRYKTSNGKEKYKHKIMISTRLLTVLTTRVILRLCNVKKVLSHIIRSFIFI